GDPYVIEYNVRMGDPETEVVLPRIESDLVELFDGVATQQLSVLDLKISPYFATTVVCTSCGYPGDYPKGLEIDGLEKRCESTIFHAGTKIIGDRYFTNGGRVLAVTSMAPTMKGAVIKSYNTIKKITFDGMYYRRDISLDL
ncbi:MAG: phosphoribosylglycinamide synthetase C domain-containing protein, partial [Rikenellaceae bacterium]